MSETLWMAHLARCNQCNYGLDCQVCEIGYCFDGAPPARTPLTGHACNCARGPGVGYLLRMADHSDIRPYGNKAEGAP